MNWKPYPLSLRRRAFKLRREGVKVHAIAQQLRVSPSWVSDVTGRLKLPPAHHCPPEQIETMRRMRSEGQSVSQIAKHLRLSTTTVRHHTRTYAKGQRHLEEGLR